MGTATIADVFNAASAAANTTTNILSRFKKEKDDLFIGNTLLDWENEDSAYLLELEQSNDSTEEGNRYERYAESWKTKLLDQWQKKNGNIDNYTRERLTLAARERENNMRPRLARAAWEKDKNHMAASYTEREQQAAIGHAGDPGGFTLIMTEAAGNLFRAGVFDETRYAAELARIPMTAMSLASKTVTDDFIASGGGSEADLIARIDGVLTEGFYETARASTEHYGREVTGEGERRQVLMSADLTAYREEIVNDAKAAWKQAAREKELENADGVYGVINGWLAGEKPLPSDIKGLVTRITGFNEFNMTEPVKNQFLRALKGFEEDPDKGPGKELIRMYAQNRTEDLITAFFEKRLPDQNIATIREILPDLLYEGAVQELGYTGTMRNFVLENDNVFHDFENTVTKLANENANIQGRFGDYLNTIKNNRTLQALFKDEYKDSAELINKNLSQRFFDIMMSSDLARISDTELKERLDGAIAAATGENLARFRNFRAGNDQEGALAEMHRIADNNSELVVRNRTQAPQYLRGFDDDPAIYQKQVEKMYEQDRIFIGRSVPDLDINKLNQINRQDVFGDDEDAAGVYQYGDTNTFYRVSADGNRIKIEKQTGGGPPEIIPVKRDVIPVGIAMRNYEERRNSVENRMADFEEGRRDIESETSLEAIYQEKMDESLTAEQRTRQSVISNIKAETDGRRKREMIERAIIAKLITHKEAEELFGYNER